VRKILLGGAAVGIATAIVVVAWQSGARLRVPTDGNSASARRPTSESAIESLADRARQAADQDRLPEAFELYRTLDSGRWRAPDCFAIASGLLRQGRLALGWAALEASRRIDPDHVATARELGVFEGKIASATGEERARIHEAARRVEVLRLIPGGPPLATLVLGLARFADHSSQEDEFLDRLGVRDRGFLREIKSTDSATMLITRLLMEVGRAPEAYVLLELLTGASTGRGDLVHDKSPTEREAAWLLSRAALQLDRHKVADAMLALAGEFGKPARPSPEPAPFVGSKRCEECHGKIFHDQQGESRHALTLRFGKSLKDVPLPAHPVPDPVVPGITHAFTRKGDDRIELESCEGNQVIRAVVEYAVGSGRHGITMIARDDQGIDRELRVSYFAAQQSWGETKGINFPPRDAGEHVGVGLSSRSLHQCLGCHTTWFRAVDLGLSTTRRPEGEDRGIGCERCHGPGLNHIKAAQSGYADMAIAQGANSAIPPRLKSCVECHAADGSVEPSDPEFTRAQGTTFLFSRCYTASKSEFGCTTCHDPHRSVETAVDHYESKCLHCHGAIKPGAGSTRPDPSPVDGKGQAAASTCPVNATGKCISCHMPKVDDPSRRSRFTDHHIRVHRRSASARTSAGSPRSASPGHPPPTRALPENERSAIIE
jgi:hypothetical protein